MVKECVISVKMQIVQLQKNRGSNTKFISSPKLKTNNDIRTKNMKKRVIQEYYMISKEPQTNQQHCLQKRRQNFSLASQVLTQAFEEILGHLVGHEQQECHQWRHPHERHKCCQTALSMEEKLLKQVQGKKKKDKSILAIKQNNYDYRCALITAKRRRMSSPRSSYNNSS